MELGGGSLEMFFFQLLVENAECGSINFLPSVNSIHGHVKNSAHDIMYKNLFNVLASWWWGPKLREECETGKLVLHFSVSLFSLEIEKSATCHLDHIGCRCVIVSWLTAGYNPTVLLS